MPKDSEDQGQSAPKSSRKSFFRLRRPAQKQSYDLHQPEPTIFHKGYYRLMQSLQLLGLASLVEGLQMWTGFFQQIVDLYQRYIRGLLYKLVILAWPAGWPPPPKIGADLLIIWGTFFAAASFHVYYAQGRNIFGSIYQDEFDLRSSKATAIFRTIVKVVTIFLIGPVLYPALAILHYMSGGRSDRPIITRWLVMQPSSILKYVGFQLLLLALLLFISYQMKKQGFLS